MATLSPTFQYTHPMSHAIDDLSTEETHLQLAELTGATLYTLARHALYPSVDFNAGLQPGSVSTLAGTSLSSSGEGILSAFAAQIGSELGVPAQDAGHSGSGFGTLCTAMAAESCVSAAIQALVAPAAGSTHRNPFHEILAGASEVNAKCDS